MATLVGLLLMLFGVCPTPVSSAVETHCDGRQDGTQCYGAVGGAVVLRLVDSASDIFRFALMFNTSQIILSVKENKISTNLLESRSIFTPSDGTFRINDLSRSDGGEYTIEMFNSQGRTLKPRTLQLFIQAPVSSVLLVHHCLSQGMMKASCSSEGGDSPEYSWTLDGRTLTDDKLLCGNHETNTIILKDDVSGLLACSVRNHISHASKEEQISTCKGHSLLICGLLFVMATLSVGGIFLFFHLKKRKYKKTKVPVTPPAMDYSENSFSVIELRG